MTESIHDYQGRLLTRIAGFLENGGRLTDAVLAYIETTLFSPWRPRNTVSTRSGIRTGGGIFFCLWPTTSRSSPKPSRWPGSS